MCVIGKENYWIKTYDAQQNLTYVENYHYDKLKPKIIKCLNCFPDPKFIQPSLHFLHQGIWKPILSGR